jgi:hypothetical protein
MSLDAERQYGPQVRSERRRTFLQKGRRWRPGKLVI